MIQKVYKLLFILLIFTSPLYSQIGGKGIYQFLELNTSARQTAMGGKIVSVKDSDPNFAMWNPAVVNSTMDGKVAINYVDYFSDINYGSVVYAREIEEIGTFFTNLTYVNYGEFTRSTVGEDQGRFSANELAINVGYAYEIDSLFSVGANFKVINSVLDTWNSFGVAFDLGASYRIPSKNMTLGLVVRNAGLQLKTYSGHDRENLPFEIIFGVSQTLEHLPLRWNISLENLQKWNIAFSNPSFAKTDLEGNVNEEDVNFLNHFARHIVVGAELFPERSFSARVSYNFRRGAEMKLADYNYFGGLSLGFGMKIKKFRINYARSLYHPAGGTNNFSIISDLNLF